MLSLQMYNLYDAEIQALQPPEDIGIVEWVEKHRVLPKGSAIPGPKRIDRTPAVRIIYDWFQDISIREMTCQKPAQIGLTDAIVDLILWIASNDPSPTALFLADADTARKIMKFRIVPALSAMGTIEYTTDNRNKSATKFECSLPNGFYLAVSWGSSISQTGSMAFKYVFCDEINKPGYDAVGKEGNTLGRIRERMESYTDSKFFKFSTPTIEAGNVTKEINLAHSIYDFRVPCKHCGAHQPLVFKSVVWEGGTDATFQQIEDTARYKCIECEGLWTTVEKNEALSKGIFVSRTPEVKAVRHVGLQLHRLGSLFNGGRLEVMIDRWIKAQKDGPDEIQNVVNSVFGEPWTDVVTKVDDSTSRQSRIEYDINIVPDAAVALIVTVDVQKYGYWYLVRAWASNETSWKIEHGFVSTEKELDHIVFNKTWRHGKGLMKAWRVGIDIGGGEHSETGESSTEWVYRWYIKNFRRGPRIILFKGASHRLPQEIKIGDPIFTLPSGKRMSKALRVVSIDTNKTKDLFFWRVKQATAETPICPAYVSTNEKEEYFKQIQAEHKVMDGKRSVWKQKGSQDNHLLDCEQMQVAAASRLLMGGVFLLAEPVGLIVTQQKRVEVDEQEEEPTTRRTIRRRIRRR